MDPQLADSPTIYNEPDGVWEDITSIAGGSVGVCHSRCPGRQTPNEDVAALVPFGPGTGLLVIADGCGGHAAGAEASRAAVEAMILSAELSLREGDVDEARAAVLRGFDAANEAVQRLGGGAGCTLSVVEVAGTSVRSYHVGDSQMLVVGQRGRIRAQTIPHSPVGYGVEAGLIDEHEAMHHEERHVVSNIVGSPEMRIEMGPAVELAPRDTVLVASDGLFDNLRLEEIVERIRKGSLQDVVSGLCNTALERMSGADPAQPSKPDDLSFILYRPMAVGG